MSADESAIVTVSASRRKVRFFIWRGKFIGGESSGIGVFQSLAEIEQSMQFVRVKGIESRTAYLVKKHVKRFRVTHDNGLGTRFRRRNERTRNIDAPASAQPDH